MKQRQDQISRLIAEVEQIAKRIRSEVRKRADSSGVAKNLRDAARDLRKQGAEVAGQVERYAHELRIQLEGRAVSAKRRPAVRATRKVGPRRRQTEIARRGVVSSPAVAPTPALPL